MKIEIVSRLLNFFFPSRCMFCDNFVPYKEYVCKTCESRVVEGGYITNIPIKTCTTLIFAFYYHLVTNSVYKLKLSHDRYSAKALAHFLSKAVDNNIDIKKIDVIISSPKYFNKRCRNKFNHAHVLAKEVADVLGVFYAPNVLVKIKKTSK
ncbi:MAG: double zinc ribbon domain-containing protein, partial [Oscillospiraceae bacterium]